MEYRPIRFINEEVMVYFSQQPMLEKKPDCPDGFTWGQVDHTIVETISEWVNYDRSGRMARNMTPTHTETAKRRGSWGVGEFYFRVRTEAGRIFDLYYDRAPKSVHDRKGHWFLDRELEEMNRPED